MFVPTRCMMFSFLILILSSLHSPQLAEAKAHISIVARHPLPSQSPIGLNYTTFTGNASSSTQSRSLQSGYRPSGAKTSWSIYSPSNGARPTGGSTSETRSGSLRNPTGILGTAPTRVSGTFMPSGMPINQTEVKISMSKAAAAAASASAAAAASASAVALALKTQQSAINRCRSGDLNNPTPNDWKAFSVDAWWIAFRRQYKGDSNNNLTITDLVTKHFNRPALSIACNADSTSCGGGIGDCVQWLNSAPDQSASGLYDTAKAYVWFTGYSYLGNIVSAISVNTNKAAAQVGLEIEGILTKFTNPPKPPKGLDRIASGAGPALGAIGGIFGLLGKGAPGAAFSGFGNLISSLGNSFYVANQVAGDNRIDTLGGLSTQYAGIAYIISQGLIEAFNTIILFDNGTANEYAALADILKGGFFLDFKIAYAWNSGEISTAVYNGVMKFFQFQAINTIWRLLNVFAVWVPYNSKVLDASATSWSGNKWRDNFSKRDCEEIILNKGKLWYPTADCTDEAMVFLISDYQSGLSEMSPTGSTETVTLVGNTKVSFRDITASSVGGWKNIGWNANISNPAYHAIVSNTGEAWKDITVADMTRFNEIGPRNDGVFNVPICRTYDIRFFVGLQDANDGNPGPGLPDYAAFCMAKAANSPAQQDQFFRDHIDQGLAKGMRDHHVWGGDTWVGDGWDKVPL